MALPGETVGTHRTKCTDCGEWIEIDVYHSNAGYYIGFWCDCGPYSRESGYYRTHGEALHALQTADFGR